MSNPNLRKKLVPSQEHSVVDKSAQEGNGAQEENADVTINNINENKIANTIENKKKVGGNGNSDDDEKILNSLIICYLTDSFYYIIKKRLKIQGRFHLNLGKKR